MKKMKNKKKKSISYYIVLIILIGVVIASGYYIYVNQKNSKKTLIPQVEKLIEEKEKQNYQDKEDNKKEINNYINYFPSIREQYNNPNIMGRLEVPNLNIDSYVTRAADNAFYLNYNIYNQYDALGVPFFDYRNISLNTDKQINIYGHNTRNERYFDVLPFINLEAYIDENIFNNYKDIYLSIDERQIHYEVIAIKIITGDDNEHMKIIFRNNEDYLKHVSKLLQNTLYKENNLEITSEDNLLVLQVCHYNPPDTFLLVIAREKK